MKIYEIGPLIPMAMAFISIGTSLFAALPFIRDHIGFAVDLGAGLFLIGVGIVCAFGAKKSGTFRKLMGAIK